MHSPVRAASESRRRSPVKQIEKTLGLIMESAKKEFLSKGYEKASLRTIAQNAGVTTGALYVRFSNKNEMFSALVSPVAEHVLSAYRKGGEEGNSQLEQGCPQDMWAISDEIANELLEYIFKNKDEFVLLINCSAGSRYEHFMDDLVGEVERQSVNFLKYLRKKGYPCPDISKEELHILISAQYYAIFEIVRHDIPKKKAIKRIRLIIDFFRPGWKNIFGQ